jgi:uncharacterized membrane protein
MKGAWLFWLVTGITGWIGRRRDKQVTELSQIIYFSNVLFLFIMIIVYLCRGSAILLSIPQYQESLEALFIDF